MAEAQYYLPHGTRWPIIGSIGLTTLRRRLRRGAQRCKFRVAGHGPCFVILMVMIYLWFGQVVRESESRSYNNQVERSFRWGMGWFIFSEVCFFGAFFGALFYARIYSVPWLGGEGTGVATNCSSGPSSIRFGRPTARMRWRSVPGHGGLGDPCPQYHHPAFERGLR